MTRGTAAVVDLAVLVLAMGLLFLAVAGVLFAWSPLAFRWPAPSWPVTVGVGAVVAAVYLTVAWATTGRTVGGALLGLRVRSARRARLGWTRAAVRAVLCLVFPVGLLWAAVDRRRRSLQDLVVRSAVLYDWSDDAGVRVPAGPVLS